MGPNAPELCTERVPPPLKQKSFEISSSADGKLPLTVADGPMTDEQVGDSRLIEAEIPGRWSSSFSNFNAATCITKRGDKSACDEKEKR